MKLDTDISTVNRLYTIEWRVGTHLGEQIFQYIVGNLNDIFIAVGHLRIRQLTMKSTLERRCLPPGHPGVDHSMGHHPGYVPSPTDRLNLALLAQKHQALALQYPGIPGLYQQNPHGSKPGCISAKARGVNPMFFLPPLLPVNLQAIEVLRQQQRSRSIQTEAYLRLMEAHGARAVAKRKTDYNQDCLNLKVQMTNTCSPGVARSPDQRHADQDHSGDEELAERGRQAAPPEQG